MTLQNNTNGENVMTKIGKRLCITVGVLMLACIIVISGINSFLFYRRNMDTLEIEVDIDRNVLQNKMTDLCNSVIAVRDNLVTNTTFCTAIKTGNKDTIDENITTCKGSLDLFAVIYDKNGTVIYSTEGFDTSNLKSTISQSGFTSGTNTTALYYIATTEINDMRLVIGIDMSNNEYIDSIQALTGAEVTLFADTTRIATTLVDKNGKRAIGTSMDADIAAIVKDRLKEYTGRTKLYGTNYQCTYYPLTDENGYVGAMFVGTSTLAGDNATTFAVFASQIGGLIVLIIAIICMIVLVKHRIVTPVLIANELANKMSAGDLTPLETPDGILTPDEVGDMVRTLQDTQQNFNAYITDISNVLTAMASGDFTVKPNMQYVGAFKTINDAFDGISERLGKTIVQLGVTANEVTSGTAQIATGSQLLADGTTRQAAAIEELSASISEIADKVQRNAENAAEANRCAVEASEKVDAQAKSMAEVHDAMSDIHAKSEQISDIIKTIEDIAFQTNILALNAAVEAARAGDAGRGFAVVADEVRNLASKSDEAAKQTADIINDTIHAVNHGSIIVDETVKDVKSVTEITKQMQTLVNTISAASEEQSVAIEQINTGVVQISEVVQQNSATAEESAASCDELNNHANVLNQQISQFKVNNK